MIKTIYEKETIFQITGLPNITNEEQLEHFNFTLNQFNDSGLPLESATSWLRAFQLLTLLLDKKLAQTNEKKVIFFDELPWLAGKKSRFLTGMEFFWNSWAVNKNVVVVLCGSSASWMIQKIVNNTGGLYNRITKRIFLKPFSLAETKAYLTNQYFNFTNYQIVELYMALGGIPHYLKEVKGNKSVVQNIDDLCFSDTGLLKREFPQMFASLFENAEKHVAVIRTLATSNQGLTRKRIVKLSQLPENGNTSRVLEELEQSGFITSYYPFGKKKKDKLFRLTDEYSLFYLQWIENKVHEGSGTWQHLSQTPQYKTWSGYAFESICLKHIPQIKKALSIGGVYSLSSTFYKKGTATEKGAQIDLLLDRNDRVINVFEIKFSNKEVTISKEYADTLRRKMWTFEETTKTRKQLQMIFITTYGLEQNMHSLGLVQSTLVLDNLFLE
ncbi:MAG: ATP-binding protein [Bacteroidota bacterium]